MKRYFQRASSLALLTLLLLLPSSQAQAAAEPGRVLTLLETLLQPDGSLNLKTGFSGSLDMTGWTMTVGPGGAPRFARGVPPQLGNKKWSAKLDPKGTNNDVNALAVMGDDLYVGGNFTAAGSVSANFIARWSPSANTSYGFYSWSALGRDN